MLNLRVRISHGAGAIIEQLELRVGGRERCERAVGVGLEGETAFQHGDGGLGLALRPAASRVRSIPLACQKRTAVVTKRS